MDWTSALPELGLGGLLLTLLLSRTNTERGADGRGVVRTEVVHGRLFVTYTDAVIADAGAVPTGPAQFTITMPDGATLRCVRSDGDDGASYVCSVD
jgi:hypothetical protein